MNSKLLVLGSLLVLASCSQPGGRAEETSGEQSAPATTAAAQPAQSTWSGDRPIPIAAADLKWGDLDPTGAPGVKLAPVWGDPGKGAFGAFLMLPAGFAVPPHKHTHPMKVVVVSGTYIQGPEGAPEFRLGPGSYLMQPGGEYLHTTSCDTGSNCVIFVESDGAFDLTVPEAAPAR